MVEHGRLRAKAALPEPRAEQIIGSHPVYAGGEGFALSFHLALHPGSVACRCFEAPSALVSSQTSSTRQPLTMLLTIVVNP